MNDLDGHSQSVAYSQLFYQQLVFLSTAFSKAKYLPPPRLFLPEFVCLSVC